MFNRFRIRHYNTLARASRLQRFTTRDALVRVIFKQQRARLRQFPAQVEGNERLKIRAAADVFRGDQRGFNCFPARSSYRDARPHTRRRIVYR